MSTVEMMQALDAAADRAFDDMTPEEVRARWGIDNSVLPPKYYAIVHGVETLAALKSLFALHEPEGRFQPHHFKAILRQVAKAIGKAENKTEAQVIEEARKARQ